MNLHRLVIALFLGSVLSFSAVICEAQTVDQRPAAVVAQQDPAPMPRRPAQRSPSDLDVPDPNEQGQVDDAGKTSCQTNCSPCRPVRRCCRPLLRIFRRCR